MLLSKWIGSLPVAFQLCTRAIAIILGMWFIQAIFHFQAPPIELMKLFQSIKFLPLHVAVKKHRLLIVDVCFIMPTSPGKHIKGELMSKWLLLRLRKNQGAAILIQASISYILVAFLEFCRVSQKFLAGHHESSMAEYEERKRQTTWEWVRERGEVVSNPCGEITQTEWNLGNWTAPTTTAIHQWRICRAKKSPSDNLEGLHRGSLRELNWLPRLHVRTYFLHLLLGQPLARSSSAHSPSSSVFGLVRRGQLFKFMCECDLKITSSSACPKSLGWILNVQADFAPRF